MLVFLHSITYLLNYLNLTLYLGTFLAECIYFLFAAEAKPKLWVDIVSKFRLDLKKLVSENLNKLLEVVTNTEQVSKVSVNTCTHYTGNLLKKTNHIGM